jgi:uncharacterized protein YdeI (YjbR/CyaY-like superfamily)
MWQASNSGTADEAQVQILMDALKDKHPAYDNFKNMSASVKKTYTLFYLDAKKEETRLRRLNKIVDRLNQNLKPM